MVSIDVQVALSMHLFVPIKFTALNVWATEMEIIAAVSMHAECNDL